ncbi:hypothetical protein [Legionella oakridgensis]|uniref:hypothetical protein n=1 Tax=Legionella oakridgensis TaxID=29423 RepID=UPI0003DE409E|nr:hypothetical protein [Legionella oakridgensis]ETO94456.1 hypothetical protein LOR_49c09740 [Legionella oakridgensis RV-2-2007]
MPDSNEALTIELQDHSTIVLRRKEKDRELSGSSKKGVYQDQDEREYYVKEPKPRKVTEIFKKDVFFNTLIDRRRELLDGSIDGIAIPDDEEILCKIEELSVENRRELDQIQDKLKNYVRHVDELILSNSALEVIASRVSAAIMGDLVIVPQNYLHIHDGQPLIASPSVGRLVEFLSEHSSVEAAKTPEYWLSHPAPSFTTLVTTREQARLLGQAYFIALLFSHYDLVNNINLSNFGYVRQSDDTLKLSIVDWGNSLGVGFSGLTAEEGAFKNPQFARQSDRADYLGHRPEDITGFQHVMPFDEVVYPLLPRQVVPNLFDLTAEDEPALREAQRLGFYEACDRAMSVLDELQELIPTIITRTLHEAMSAEDSCCLQPLLPSLITKDNRGKKDEYTLANILEGRMRSLQQMKEALQGGKTLQDIARERLMAITKSQMLPSVRFFSSAKAASVSPESLMVTRHPG